MMDSISIRIAPISPREISNVDARSAFWSAARQIEQFSNQSPEQLEARVLHEFGTSLREQLVAHVREELAEIERGIFGDSVPKEMWRFLDHELHFMMRERGTWPYAWTDPFVKYFELRQHAVTEVPAFAQTLERLSAAAAVRSFLLLACASSESKPASGYGEQDW